ncbi:MAG: hypothetical protein M3Y53_11480 [Thermoproteota archaeon]|nr:hypothetical protein [Thermoproteota archaeon]
MYRNKRWVDWGDFLGTFTEYSKEFLPFEEAREFIRKLKLKTVSEYRKYWSKNEPAAASGDLLPLCMEIGLIKRGLIEQP